MATAVNVIANGGEYVSPSLVEGRATTASGTVVGTSTSVRKRVVSASAARQTADMMELVTTEGVGTAAGAGIGGYRVAGKTGTAQEVGGACSCYSQGWLAVSLRRVRPGRRPPLHRLRGDQEARRRCERRRHGGPGVPQDPQLRDAEVRRGPDRHHPPSTFPPGGVRARADSLDRCPTRA